MSQVGIHNQPEDVRRSVSGRPCIEAVDFEYKPFYPLALALLARDVGAEVGEVATRTAVSTEPVVTYKSQKCGAYSTTNTDTARQLYQICEIEACDGDLITASSCAADSGSCRYVSHFHLLICRNMAISLYFRICLSQY